MTRTLVRSHPRRRAAAAGIVLAAGTVLATGAVLGWAPALPAAAPPAGPVGPPAAAAPVAPVAPAPEPDADGFVPLFNGKDLAGWVPVNVAPDTFTVKDGLIVCTGLPTGVMRTEKMYENFVVELEWRHLRPGGNSGFFIFSDATTARGVPFSRGLEIQILDGKTPEDRRYTTQGDVFPIHGATARPDHPGKFGMRSYPTEDRTKPSPEWNHYRIESRDGVVTLAVNGKVVNSTREVSPRRGYLCLESEGGLVHFRNLRIRELPPARDLDPKHVAQADQGFKSLYTGLDLAGWKVAEGAADGWQPANWTLKFDPAKVKPGADRVLRTARAYKEFELMLDVRSEYSVQLMFGETAVELNGAAADPAAQDNAGLKVPADPGGKTKPEKAAWRRVLVRVKGEQVDVAFDGMPASGRKLPAAAGAPLGVRPGGAAELANLYIREVEATPAR